MMIGMIGMMMIDADYVSDGDDVEMLLRYIYR